MKHWHFVPGRVRLATGKPSRRASGTRGRLRFRVGWVYPGRPGTRTTGSSAGTIKSAGGHPEVTVAAWPTTGPCWAGPLWAFRRGKGWASDCRVQPRQSDAVDQFVAREANGYKAEGFSRDSESFISMNRNKESSLPGITSMPSISRHVIEDKVANDNAPQMIDNPRPSPSRAGRPTTRAHCQAIEPSLELGELCFTYSKPDSERV